MRKALYVVGFATVIVMGVSFFNWSLTHTKVEAAPANSALVFYGCVQDRDDNGYLRSRACILYDPNLNHHYVVVSNPDGGTAMIEEK